MPAITVDDVLVLPRLPRLDRATTTPRPVRRVTTAPSGFEGEGFPVRRAFAGAPVHERVEVREVDAGESAADREPLALEATGRRGD